MKNNLIIAVVITVLVSGGGGFYAGIKYQKDKAPIIPENIEQMRGQIGQRNSSTRGLNTVMGKIIGTDESSITVQLADDSSKIIIVTEGTMINRSEAGTADDLREGSEVVVNGQPNSDGSISAQNIQIGTGFMKGSRPE